MDTNEGTASTCEEIISQDVDHQTTQGNKLPPTPNKRKKAFVSPRKNQRKMAEDPRIGEAYNALQTALSKTRDEFDAYGEYIANVLRSMDKGIRPFVKKEFSDTIFRAESGCFEHSRPSSSNSDYSFSSHLPIPSTQHVHAHELMQSNIQQTSTSDNTEQGSPHFRDLLDL